MRSLLVNAVGGEVGLCDWAINTYVVLAESTLKHKVHHPPAFRSTLRSVQPRCSSRIIHIVVRIAIRTVSMSVCITTQVDADVSQALVFSIADDHACAVVKLRVRTQSDSANTDTGPELSVPLGLPLQTLDLLMDDTLFFMALLLYGFFLPQQFIELSLVIALLLGELSLSHREHLVNKIVLLQIGLPLHNDLLEAPLVNSCVVHFTTRIDVGFEATFFAFLHKSLSSFLLLPLSHVLHVL